ncbi:hypothetical protein K439DRAFT_751556 [Ramaria rubella]|nr:hypothetical protein K439DRAFT_751556 [Ramaria rubella]
MRMAALTLFAPDAPTGISGVRMGQVDWLNRVNNYVIPCASEGVEMASLKATPYFSTRPSLKLHCAFHKNTALMETLREKKILHDACQ